jgi:hypothetical protein
VVRLKSFNTSAQERVYGQVRNLLDNLVDEHFDDAEHCDFYLKYGSTVIEISIKPYEEDESVVEVLAYCVQGVEPSSELMRELLRLNTEIPIGAFSMLNNDVYYSHSFLSRDLQPDQLIASLNSVATISDLYDEKIIEKHGGQTAIDRLRSFSREFQSMHTPSPN